MSYCQETYSGHFILQQIITDTSLSQRGVIPVNDKQGKIRFILKMTLKLS